MKASPKKCRYVDFAKMMGRLQPTTWDGDREPWRIFSDKSLMVSGNWIIYRNGLVTLLGRGGAIPWQDQQNNHTTLISKTSIAHKAFKQLRILKHYILSKLEHLHRNSNKEFLYVASSCASSLSLVQLVFLSPYSLSVFFASLRQAFKIGLLHHELCFQVGSPCSVYKRCYTNRHYKTMLIKWFEESSLLI